MKPIVTTDPISEMQIAEWKEKYPRGIFEIEVACSDEPLIRQKEGGKEGETEEYYEYIKGYFRKPDVTEIGLATQGNEKAPLKIVGIIYNTCFIGGHPDFQSNEDVKLSAYEKMAKLTKKRVSVIKKV